jgi:hypothetical protein
LPQKHYNLDILKRSLVKKAAEIPMEKMHAAIAEWQKHLKTSVLAKGGNFE